MPRIGAEGHRHRVDQANTGQYGVVRYATDAEALLGTSSSRTIAPSNLGPCIARRIPL